MTPQPNILNMFRQMMTGGRSMSQRAGTFARMVGRISMGAMGGPLGLGIMAGSMILPAMMASRGGGGGGAQPAGGALESLSEELEQVTSGLHRMNVEIKQLSDSVGQTSADTMKMGGMFAAIGSDSPIQAGAQLASQLGRQTGAMRLGQVNQQSLMGAGMLGMNPGQMMEQSPAEQMRYMVDELRKLNKTELNSMDTLAALEMMLPGQGQNLIAMAGMSGSAIQAQRNYEAAITAFMTGPRGKALEEQSQGLLAIAARIALQADLFQREKQYLSSPFAEEGAERAEQRGKVGRQFGLGMLEGLQGTKVILETWARSIHEVFQRLFGGNAGSQLRDIGWILGDMVSGILEVVHAGVIFGSWIKDLAKLLISIVNAPMEWARGKSPGKPIGEAWGGLNFEQGTMTGDLMYGMGASQRASNAGDARMGAGMNRGYPGMTSNRNMGNGMQGGGMMTVEFKAKDDFANMLQYGIRESTNQGRAVPGPVTPRVPSIATR